MPAPPTFPSWLPPASSCGSSPTRISPRSRRTGSRATRRRACSTPAPRDATLHFTFFFEDRDPIGPVEITLGARRTRHVRLDDPTSIGGVELPRGVPYAYAVESDEPVVLQHSRLDTSAGAYTLFTTIAYGE